MHLKELGKRNLMLLQVYRVIRVFGKEILDKNLKIQLMLNHMIKNLYQIMFVNINIKVNMDMVKM